MRVSFQVVFMQATLVLLPALQGFCATPDVVNLEEALSSAHVVFLGRIIRIEEVVRASWGTQCEMTMVVAEELKGDSTPSNGNIAISYVCESKIDRILPVQFAVTESVLVAVSKKTDENDGVIVFDSHLENGTDVAFVLIGSSADEYLDNQPVVFADIFSLRSRITTTRDRVLSFTER